MKALLSRPLRLSSRQVLISKTLVHLIALGYLIVMFYLGFTDNLGADPVKSLLHFTGIGGLNMLMITLVVSPMARWLPCGDLMRFRRLLGIYAFVYASCHLLSYIFFELQYDFSLLARELIERPYITVGFAAFVILMLLTLTSPMAARKSLGRRWQTLHNTIYLCLLLALLHYTWSLKTLWGDPVFYWVAAILLLSLRWNKFFRLRSRTRT